MQSHIAQTCRKQWDNARVPMHVLSTEICQLLNRWHSKQPVLKYMQGFAQDLETRRLLGASGRGRPASQPASQPASHPSIHPSIHPPLPPSVRPSVRPLNSTPSPNKPRKRGPTFSPASQSHSARPGSVRRIRWRRRWSWPRAPKPRIVWGHRSHGLDSAICFPRS